MCAVFSCLGGAKKSLKEKKAGSHVKLGERLVMRREEEGPYCGARSWTVLLPKRDETKVGLVQGLTAETTPFSAGWSLKPSYHGFSLQQ